MSKLLRMLRNKKGQSLVEYGIIIGGVALVTLAAVAILGHKTNDLVASVAAALPGAHADDNGPIVSGKLVKTTTNSEGGLVLNATETGSIEENVGIPGISSLVLEPPE